jgi:hypothetical protein
MFVLLLVSQFQIRCRCPALLIMAGTACRRSYLNGDTGVEDSPAVAALMESAWKVCPLILGRSLCISCRLALRLSGVAVAATLSQLNSLRGLKHRTRSCRCCCQNRLQEAKSDRAEHRLFVLENVPTGPADLVRKHIARVSQTAS